MKRRPQVLHLDTLPQGVLLYTKPQMAAALQVSVRCVTKMISRGELSYLKIHGRMVRFRADEVLRRLNETSLVCQGTTTKEGPRE